MNRLGYTQKGGIFGKLKNPEYFKRFEANRDLGTLFWGEDVDIAPETLYSKATCEPLPKWIEQEIAAEKTT